MENLDLLVNGSSLHTIKMALNVFGKQRIVLVNWCLIYILPGRCNCITIYCFDKSVFQMYYSQFQAIAIQNWVKWGVYFSASYLENSILNQNL